MNSNDKAMRWGIALLLMIACLQVVELATSPRWQGGSFAGSAVSPGSAGHPQGSFDERAVLALERIEQLLASSSGSRLQSPKLRSDLRAAESGSSERESPDSFTQLARSLDALRESFERETTATQEVLRSSPVFGEEALRVLRDEKLDPDWRALEELEQSWIANPEQANRSQYFLTPQDLLKLYGPPTNIYRPQGGLNFYSRQHPKGDSGPAWSFRIQEGFVVGFWLEYE